MSACACRWARPRSDASRTAPGAQIEDQVPLCRTRAEQQGWSGPEVFPDFALSGATRDRPGLDALLARAGEFDVVPAEALNRISRDQEDVAAIWKRIEFAGAGLWPCQRA